MNGYGFMIATDSLPAWKLLGGKCTSSRDFQLRQIGENYGKEKGCFLQEMQ
jgi:hypothetical protein